MAINLRFASGVLGSFMLSDAAACARSWEQTSQENKAHPSRDDEDCYIVTGTNGSLSVPTMTLKTYPRPGDRSWWKPFELGVVGMVRADPLKHQIGALRRGSARRGAAAGQRARRAGQPEGHRGDRRGGPIGRDNRAS